MRFGAFCPFPLPLGGDYTANQHAATARDLTSLRRSSNHYFITLHTDGYVESYVGINGEGTGNAPILTVLGTGEIRLSFPVYKDSVTDNLISTNITSAVGTINDGSFGFVIALVEPSKKSIIIRTLDSGGNNIGARIAISINGHLKSNIGYYGSSLDKIDSFDEEDIPYAFGFYSQLTAGLGDALTNRYDSWIHCRKLALARALAGDFRLGNKVSYNKLPGTSDELLNYWGEVLNVPYINSETKEDYRLKLKNKYKTSQGPTIENEDNLIRELLGDGFVRCERVVGSDLASPPFPTYWLDNPGAPTYNLGAGTWLSRRRHLVVVVKKPVNKSLSEFERLINVELFKLLDDLLPSTVTFSWAFESLDGLGFRLDVSQMDYVGFGI